MIMGKEVIVWLSVYLISVGVFYLFGFRLPKIELDETFLLVLIVVFMCGVR